MARPVKLGINDLITWCKKNNRTDLLDEWDTSNDVLPNQISYGSHKKIQWLCKNGHKYIKDIHSRCQGIGCPICSGVNFEHRKGLFEEFPEFISELDTNINEYNKVKDISCCSKKQIQWRCKNGHSYSMSALSKIKSKGCPYCNNIRVLSGVNDLESWCKNNNRTQILSDWDYHKNAVLPSEILPGSNKKIWYKCHICGFEWATTAYSRTLGHTDCRMCSRRISSSFPEQCIFYYIHSYFSDAINGDLTILNGRELDIWIPSLYLAIEYDGRAWHKESSRDREKDILCKNKGVTLYRIRETGCSELSSDYSISYEYEYGDWNALSKIISEILHDMGVLSTDVDIFRDEYIIKEQYYRKSLDNSLSNLYPNIANEWHPTKNGNITPNLIIAETHDQYFWLCPKGHTYKASPKNRIRMKSGCPYCSNQKILKGFNDLETTNPEIALDYDNEKNSRKSYEVSKGCSDFVWLKCHKCGYEFYYQLNTYVSRGGLCPACSNMGKTKFKKVLKYETKEIFDTLPLAAKSLTASEKDITRIYKNIHNSCSGKCATAYGFHWFYISVDKDGNILDDIDSFEIKNYNKHITGESKLMNNGQQATVIRDNGSMNIDIQFEDGTIVNTRRQAFKSGTVRNPNYLSSGKKSLNKASSAKLDQTIHVTGQTLTMKTGETAVCINDNGWDDIDIQFNDGTIVKNLPRKAFLDGTAENPNFIYSLLGEERKMNCGMTCKIISINSKDDISVQFENGDIVEHTTYLRLKKGTIRPHKSIVGRTVIMKSGESATCIRDSGWNDIDIQFDDGTKLHGISRQRFLSGTVKNPNFVFSFIGKEKKMNCGMNCKIISITSKDDITVQFDNNDIVEHTSLLKFNKGTILTNALSKNYKYITGQRKLMKCGMYATVIADRGAHDIDVMFDDGSVVYNKDRANFNRGNISNAKNSSIVGMTKVMNNGLSATVIADNGWNDIDVRFENGVIVSHRRREHFKNGSISF